eukprot:gene36835-biopygen29706
MVFNYPSLNDIVGHLSELVGLTEHVKAAEIGTRALGIDVGSDVVVVGMACRFPKDTNSLTALWDVMTEKIDLITEASLSRWDSDSIIAGLDYDEKLLNRIRFGGFLSDEIMETFDYKRFGISESEAKHMHPMQRLSLEVAYEALIESGYNIDEIRGRRLGVFVGASGELSGNPSTSQISSSESMSVYEATGSSLSVVAGRISFVFGLQGPCSTSDTACSSSLVALHSARRSLQLGECEAAIVIAVNVLTVGASLACAIAGMTSEDGRCHTFDNAAN